MKSLCSFLSNYWRITFCGRTYKFSRMDCIGHLNKLNRFLSMVFIGYMIS